MRLLIAAAFLSLSLLAGAAHGGHPLVEMTVGTTTYEGRILASDKFTCWLAESTGAFRRIPLGNVTAFRDRSGGFKPLTGTQLRELLRTDLGGGLEMEIVGNHLVCAGPGRARSYGTLLDSTARAFAGYVSRRTLPAQKMEYPLVAIIFPTWDQFRRYADADGVRANPTLRGYYNPVTNRIALYEGSPPKPTVAAPPRFPTAALAFTGERAIPPSGWDFAGWDFAGSEPGEPEPLSLGAGSPFAALSGADLKETLIHESIHQLAFNTGLHSRFGEEPRWLVEGFAMLLESESQLRDEKSANAGDRVDLERYMTFQQALPKRPKGMLAALVGTDDTFTAAPLNSYAEAWALSFFLIETRSARYSDYLKRLARRDRLSAYAPADRLKDFREAFGAELPMIDSQLLQFVSDLKVRNRTARR